MAGETTGWPTKSGKNLCGWPAAATARILLVPSDMCQRGQDADGNPLPGEETLAAYERRLAQPSQYGRWAALGENKQIAYFQFLYRDAAADPDDERFYEQLARATGVWLPAYDQSWLPEQLADDDPTRASRFQLALRDVVARGGIVGGLGGGMASLPETIIAEDIVDEQGGWVRARLRFGLALFTGAVVDQNFDSHAGRLERLTDLLRNGPRSTAWRNDRVSSGERSGWASNGRPLWSSKAIRCGRWGRGGRTCF